MVSQGVGGHEGYSGTPLWKVQQQNAAQREAALQESLAYAAERTKPVPPVNVLAEAVSIGGLSGKRLVRHVLIKCLRKVAQNSRVDLPTSGLFSNQAPIGLYCLFDGQSSAGEAGPAAAEYCARNFYKKVLENLSSLPAGATSDIFVKAALVKTFEDLDKEILEQPDVKDGCGASIALIIGEYLFTAVLGNCDATLCEAENTRQRAVPLGRSQGRCHLPEERARLQRAGGAVIGEGATARVVIAGGTSSVSRSLGDPLWKGVGGGSAVLSCIPEIHSIKLSWAEKHLYLFITAKPLAEALTSQQMVDSAGDFAVQPRAACGELIQKASSMGVAPTDQCTAIQVCFLRGGPYGGEAEETVGGEAPKKKPRLGAAVGAAVETKSARLRHIMVNSQETPTPPVPGQKAEEIRTRVEAEALLRQLLREFKTELEDLRRKHGRLKKPEDLWQKSGLFAKLCKEYSVCPTAQKGGGMCGDLGWVSREAQRKFSREFHDAVSVLRPGDWSDIVPSSSGLHIVQRIA